MPRASSSSTSGRRVATLAVAATLFLSSLSQTVVSPALPRIVGELGGMKLYSWVLTSSMLASTVAIALSGKLTDRYGRKPFLVGGIVVFLSASAANGAAPSIGYLIAFRAVQGLGGGVIAASSFAIIGDLFSPAERGRSMGLFTGVFGVASIAGPLLGGFVTDHVGWRWLFYANIPLGLVVLAILVKGLPRARPSGRLPPLDIAGMAALIAMLLPMLFALTLAGHQLAWRSYGTAMLFAASAAAAVALVVIERRARDPVVPLPAFRDRTFVVVSAVSFLTGVGLFGSLSYMPLFIQGVLGSSATNSGLVNTPLMLSLTVGSVVAGNLAARTLRYRNMVLLGGAIVCGGMLLMATLDESSSVVLPLTGMAVIGLGLGVMMPLMGLAVQNALPDSLLGVASASTQFFRQVGGTVGIAVGGTLVMTSLHDGLARQLPSELAVAAPPETLHRLETPALLLSPAQMSRMREAFGLFGPNGPALYDDTLAAMRHVLAGGLHEVFVAGFIVALAALAVSALMPNAKLRTAMLPAAALSPSITTAEYQEQRTENELMATHHPKHSPDLERSMRLATALTPSEREQLLVSCWMAHDARWYMAVAKTYGIEAASAINVVAARDTGAAEARRAMHALRIDPPSTLEDCVTAQEAMASLLVPGLVDYALTLDDTSVRFDVGRCFAHENVTRAGVAESYRCGIFPRLQGWWDAFDVDYALAPEPGPCPKVTGGECAYTITVHPAGS
jgi:EmrB/QacA subfamily drug resistance transporter